MSLSGIRVICLDTLLYIDGIFTVSVIPFIFKCGALSKFGHHIWCVNLNKCSNMFVAVNCGDPGAVDGATRTGNDFNEGRTVSYTCAFCYQGGGNIVCQSNGQWTARPRCDSRFIYYS